MSEIDLHSLIVRKNISTYSERLASKFMNISALQVVTVPYIKAVQSTVLFSCDHCNSGNGYHSKNTRQFLRSNILSGTRFLSFILFAGRLCLSIVKCIFTV